MNQFAQILHTSSADEVNKYLDEGWDLIDTAKRSYGDGSFEIQHIVGLSYKTLAEGLLTFVKDYEKLLPKEEIFKAKAQELGENYNLYGRGGFYTTKNELTKYMKSYEQLVNNIETTYYKKGSEDEQDFNF